MTNLWQRDDCPAWHAAIAAYDDVIAVQGVARLPESDRWLRDDLPRRIAERGERPFVTRDELVQVTRWKMARGVWRARNLMLVEGNPPAAVEEASRAALRQIPDPRRPIARLAELAGVGPATASAVLAAAAPEHYPFFDELVAVQIPGLGAVKFTTGYYLAYADRLRARAVELSAACAHPTWTPHAVGQALWAASGGKAGHKPVL